MRSYVGYRHQNDNNWKGLQKALLTIFAKKENTSKDNNRLFIYWKKPYWFRMANGELISTLHIQMSCYNIISHYIQ